MTHLHPMISTLAGAEVGKAYCMRIVPIAQFPLDVDITCQECRAACDAQRDDHKRVIAIWRAQSLNATADLLEERLRDTEDTKYQNTKRHHWQNRQGFRAGHSLPCGPVRINAYATKEQSGSLRAEVVALA